MKTFLSLAWAKQFSAWIVSPSPVVIEVGARRQAELLAGLTCLFASFNIIGLLAAWRFGNVVGSLIFVALAVVSGMAYAFSRSRYYHIGLWIVLGGLTFLTFLYVSSGQTTNGPLFALLLFTPLIFVLGTAFLSVGEWVILFGVIIVGILITPWWVPEMASRAYTSTVGALLTLGVLTLVTQHYRNTIERERLLELQKAEQAAQQQAKEVNALNEIGQAIAMVEDLDRTLAKTLKALQEALPLDVFYVALYDGRNNTVSYPLFYDSGRKWEVSPTALANSISATQAITLRQPGLINRTQEEVQALQNSPNVRGERTKISVSLITAPLLIGDTVIGAISAHSYAYNAYGAEHLALLTGASYQVAIAIENARLYDALRKELIERERAETEVRATLQEKEVLLKEIHHRVKNNMQVIVSLMSLQSVYISDQRLLDIFTDSQNRVRSMALVHEKLYQSNNLAQIDFRDYLQHLVSTLFHSYSPLTSHLTLTFDVGPIALGVDAAIPCGLIVNELVSNALKHAFPNQSTGQVQISLHVSETSLLELSVTDNGVGFPMVKDWQHTESLGMQLVQSLVKQLHGHMEMTRLTPGTSFTIQFNPQA